MNVLKIIGTTLSVVPGQVIVVPKISVQDRIRQRTVIRRSQMTEQLVVVSTVASVFFPAAFCRAERRHPSLWSPWCVGLWRSSRFSHRTGFTSWYDFSSMNTSGTTTPGISATSGATSSHGLVPGQGSTALRGARFRVRPQSLVRRQGLTARRGAEEKEVMDSAEWVELRDAAGRPYFWNRRSHATVWDPLEGVWVFWIGSEDDGVLYYWHRDTRAVHPPRRWMTTW